MLVGLSLMLGLFTAGWRALARSLLLALFYVSAIPTRGLPEPRTEGAYLLVNKNLIEAAAVFVVLLFRTGRIAGLDRWLAGRVARPARRCRMNLTPEQKALGRRNFLKTLAGTPALVALGATRRPRPGPRWSRAPRLCRHRRPGPRAADGCRWRGARRYAEIRAICDINPDSLEAGRRELAKNKLPPAPHYANWQDMLQKEDIEAVVMAPPLWAHADIAVGCLDAGKHVLCEKMMAWDIAGCERMREAAVKNRRVLEIGYQRNYNPLYQAAYDGVIKQGRARRRLSRAPRLAPQRQLAPPGQAALARLRPLALGISDIRASPQLAAVLEVFEGLVRRAGQPPGQHHQLGYSAREPEAVSAPAACIASRTAGKSRITSTPHSSIRTGARRSSRRSSRTPSTITTRCTWGRRAR